MAQAAAARLQTGALKFTIRSNVSRLRSSHVSQQTPTIASTFSHPKQVGAHHYYRLEAIATTLVPGPPGTTTVPTWPEAKFTVLVKRSWRSGVADRERNKNRWTEAAMKSGEISRIRDGFQEFGISEWIKDMVQRIDMRTSLALRCRTYDLGTGNIRKPNTTKPHKLLSNSYPRSCLLHVP